MQETPINVQRGDAIERPVLSPRVDILESETEIVLCADLPGADEDAVRLSIERDTMLLEAATRLPAAEGEPLAVEFGDVLYRRAFLIPKTVDPDGISAELRNGVLRVRMPKNAQPRARRIEVQAIQ